MDERAIAIAFAPEVRLHSGEAYYPARVHWYLSRCALKLHTSDLASDPVVLPHISSIHELLSVQCQYHGGSHGSLGALDLPKATSLYVTPISSDTYAGEPDKLDQIPLYANLVYKTPTPSHEAEPSTLVIDLQYFFFYAYNGALLWYLPSAGIHEGDWEHVTIRIRIPASGVISEASIVGVFFAAHGREGRWRMTCIGRESCEPGRTTSSSSTAAEPLPPTECVTSREAPPIAQPLTTDDDLTGDWYSLNRDGHVVVYASKYVHASYPFAGRQRRFVPLGVIDDETDAAGLSWRCYHNVIVLGHVSAATGTTAQDSDGDSEERSTRWAWYTGRWGRYAANMLESSGPFGPALKAYFRSGDPEPPTEALPTTTTTTAS